MKSLIFLLLLLLIPIIVFAEEPIYNIGSTEVYTVKFDLSEGQYRCFIAKHGALNQVPSISCIKISEEKTRKGEKK